MRKIIVGIVPQVRLRTDDDPYHDQYEFLDFYSRKVIECGGIPYGILLDNGKLNEESLEFCDAFLFPGGNKIEPFHYKILQYALKRNKPVLGICLGMQAIAIFSAVLSKLPLDEMDDKCFREVYEKLKEENDNSLLEKIESPNIHGDVIVNYENTDMARHLVSIADKASWLYQIFEKEELSVVSLHSCVPKIIGEQFKITAIASDGKMEAIEYEDKNYFIVGVLWHPEHDLDNLLFKQLISEGEKRIG